MEVKEFAEEGKRQGLITIVVSLDVKEAFDAAWWLGILKTLQEFIFPRNLYYLTKSYLSERSAVMTTNTLQVERKISKGCPQGSCCGPGLWSIQYNSLLNLEIRKQTKVIAFADDLIIAVKAERISEAENITNIVMNNVLTWAKNNKLSLMKINQKL